MSLIRRGMIGVFLLLGIPLLCIDARAQSAVDTMTLTLVPPDSVYVRREGSKIVIGWYPPAAEYASIVGSIDSTGWLGPDPGISSFSITGNYTGTVDRTIKIGKVTLTTVTVDTIGPGGEASIKMYAELIERYESFYKEFNVGSSYYAAGAPIPLDLVGRKSGDTLSLGISIGFSEGIVDSTADGSPGSFEIDLQTYEGFHIWRGLSPLPTHMVVVSELSRYDAYIGIEMDSLYFLEWPKNDAQGRPYYEYVDDNVFVGFTYYYVVTCFDKGYFKGKFQHSKEDNFICDEDVENPATPGEPVPCESACQVFTMTVDVGTGPMASIFAVPNPFRTGTSADTSPFYHNFPDNGIRFFNVPKEADLKIYSVAGDLIWEAHHSDPTGQDGVLTWDVKNKNGQEVGSGVYIYRCKNADGRDMYGRIVVIR